MIQQWKVELYKSASGDKPLEEFIESLEAKARLKAFHAIELLKEFGLGVKYPHVKKLAGTNLWELRILGEDSIRIFYVAVEGQTFLLLHGFKKKRQKTPSKEIRIAEIRLQEYQVRKIPK